MRRRVAILAVFFMIAALFSGVTSAPANAQVVTSVASEGGGSSSGLASVGKAPKVAPKIRGAMAVGSSVLCTTGVWKPSPYAEGFDWYRMNSDGTKIKIYSGQRYRIKKSDRGHKLVVKVTAIHDDYVGVFYTTPRLVK